MPLPPSPLPTQCDGERIPGVLLGLSVDGGSPVQWGCYNSDHLHEPELTGEGAQLSLKFTDPAAADNAGTLTVEISCA
jgi:hypothetical protein